MQSKFLFRTNLSLVVHSSSFPPSHESLLEYLETCTGSRRPPSPSNASGRINRPPETKYHLRSVHDVHFFRGLTDWIDSIRQSFAELENQPSNHNTSSFTASRGSNIKELIEYLLQTIQMEDSISVQMIFDAINTIEIIVLWIRFVISSDDDSAILHEIKEIYLPLCADLINRLFHCFQRLENTDYPSLIQLGRIMSSLCELQDHFRIDRESFKDFEELMKLAKKIIDDSTNPDDIHDLENMLADLQASYVTIELMRQSRASPVNGAHIHKHKQGYMNKEYFEIYDMMDLVACEGRIIDYSVEDDDSFFRDNSSIDEQIRVTLDVVNQVSYL